MTLSEQLTLVKTKWLTDASGRCVEELSHALTSVQDTVAILNHR